MKNIPGFSQDLGTPDEACWGIFGAEGTGKTRLLTTAGEWAAERDQIPGWIVCDRKTKQTIRKVCSEMGIQVPMMYQEDFVSQKDALTLAGNDDEKECKRIYMAAQRKLIEATVLLGKSDHINPIVIDSGTQLWDWIAYAHFGKKQDAGRARVWGPPKQDWTDLVDSLRHKTLCITLRAKDVWRDDKKTDNLTWDGPPHLGYHTTSVIRMRQYKDDEGDRHFALDIVQSQDNKGLESVDGVLLDDDITFANLYSLLRD